MKYILILLVAINCKSEFECYTDANCDILNECIDNKCIHKEFFPYTAREVMGGLLIMVGSALSNAGGIGGGGLIIPILILQ
jgi:hypothetical protein